MRIPAKRITICAAAILINAALAFGQVDSAKVQFTQDEFNLIVSYLQKGSIPILSDSATLTAAQTLRVKADSVVTNKKPLRALNLSPQERNIVAYLMRADVASALALVWLQQKLSPPAAANGKTIARK